MTVEELRAKVATFRLIALDDSISPIARIALELVAEFEREIAEMEAAAASLSGSLSR